MAETIWHVNNEGKTGRCSAKVCPFGGKERHFADKQEAKQFGENMLNEEYGTTVNVAKTKGADKQYVYDETYLNARQHSSQTLLETQRGYEKVMAILSEFDPNLGDSEKTTWLMNSSSRLVNPNWNPTSSMMRLDMSDRLRNNTQAIVRDTMKSNLKYCADLVKNPTVTDKEKNGNIDFLQRNYDKTANELNRIGIVMKPLNIKNVVSGEPTGPMPIRDRVFNFLQRR